MNPIQKPRRLRRFWLQRGAPVGFGDGGFMGDDPRVLVAGCWKIHQTYPEIRKSLGSCLWYPLVLWWVQYCSIIFTSETMKASSLQATRLLWFCCYFQVGLSAWGENGRQLLVRFMLHGSWWLWCIQLPKCDTSFCTRGETLLPSSSYHGVVSKIGTRNKHEIDDHNVN